MSDNDIDALLRLCSVSDFEDHRRYHAALTALVADRDALLAWRSEMSARHVHLGQSYTMLSEENAILRERLKSHPLADRDRELRERLIESALQGAGCATISHQPAAELLGRQAVWLVDGALAEMRKGER